MSLLEDIFLRDEAAEAQELERIIDGDEYDEKPRQRSDSEDNSEKEDEAEEEKKRVDPSSTKTKRAVKHPRFILNPARLTGPRGIQVLPDHFKDFKFRGKGHEKEDLDFVLKKLEHWAYRLYPKFQFEDCLRKIETLGKKRPVLVHLHKIRSDQYISEETVVQKDSSDEENEPVEREEDEFDKLLQQQIELARSTPGPGSARKAVPENSLTDRSFINAPKATSSPSISKEQKERMIRNRKLAEERRLARLKNISSNIENSTNISTNNQSESLNNKIIDIGMSIPKKHNRSNVIDSSESDNEVTGVSEPVIVDIHSNINTKSSNIQDNDKFDSIINDSNSQNAEIERKGDDFDRVFNDNIVSKVSEDTEISEINAVGNDKPENVENNDISKINTLDSKNSNNADIEISENLTECIVNKDSNIDMIKDNEEINKDNFKSIENDSVNNELNYHLTSGNEDISDVSNKAIENSPRDITESPDNERINSNNENSIVKITSTNKDYEYLMEVDFSDAF